jgi:WD40 repeat protein/predicted phosphodiesterase
VQPKAIDFAIERHRHRGFVGRGTLLAQLDQLLIEEPADRWVVVTGGPGMGKSAVLSAWLARRAAAGELVPHHFIRRTWANWDDPASLVSSLVAQIEARFPEMPEPDADANLPPAARLAATLGRISEGTRVPRGQRLVVLIDGLDEYDPPPGPPPPDPLGAFLPYALPPGISFLCASRPRHPYVDALATRGVLVQLDLDDPKQFAVDNEATARAFWEQEAPALGLDARFIDEAVRRADGNLEHAAMLRKHLAGVAPSQRRVENIPRGLAALIASAWERIAIDTAIVDGLGVLCAAREALTIDEVAAVAGWTGEAVRRAFVRGARELLVESQRAEDVPAYRLHHDSIRAQVAKAIGAEALRGHHRALAQKLATWPAPMEPAARHYALRNALLHRVEANDWQDAWRVAADLAFIEAKCRELGVHEAEADVARAAERCPASLHRGHHARFADLARAIGNESHWLRAAPVVTAAVVWNRLRRIGWSTADLNQHVRVAANASFLHLRHIAARESQALERHLVGHTRWVSACAVTPDGRRVVSGSWDKTLKVWDLATGHEVATLRGHAGAVNACAVTPDGRRVVSGSWDETLKVWDLATGHELATLRGHAGLVVACAVTPDGRRVVSGSDDQTLKVWDLATGHEVATLLGHAGAVNACAVTPDGRRVVSGSDDQTLKVWDLATGHELATLLGHTGRVRACVVMPDGRRVVSSSSDQTLKVWDLATGHEVATLHGHADWVFACAVMPDGRRVVSGSEDQTLKVWDLATGHEVATLHGHADGVRACAVTPDGRRVVSGSDDKTLKVWDLATGHEVALHGHARGVSACALTPDGRCVVSGSDDETLKVWDLATKHEVATLLGHASWVSACAVTPDGRRVVSGSLDMTLKVWDLATAHEVATLHGHAGGVLVCAVTPDGRRVVSGSYDKALKVWDLATGREIATLHGHALAVLACAVTSDGQRVVSGSADQTLKVWDLATGHEIATLHGHAGYVSACAVTPDGRRVVSGSWDQTLKVWDLATGHEVATLHGHAGGVLACAVTPDGRRVVSGSEDQTLKVWDLEAGRCVFTHHASASYAAVAATATTIVAGDAAGAVWFLDLPPPNPNIAPARDEPDRSSHATTTLDAEPTSPRPLMKKHTILFLAANPAGTNQLALDREARAIQVELERAGFRDSFELVTRWAAEPLDLLRELRKVKPTVVHFSGHGNADMASRGSGDAPARDLVAVPAPLCDESPDGLFFQDPDGQPQLVSTKALQETFGAAGSSVKLVVLSACYSEAQAAALLAHVDCVIGMRGSIREAAARTFAIGFYGGLGERESVAAAYQQGCAAISLEGQVDSDRPQLKVRSGVDAARLVLATASEANHAEHRRSAGQHTTGAAMNQRANARPVRILHISDLHERTTPPQLEPRVRWDATQRGQVLGPRFFEAIRELATGGIDIVCFTGDVADWGHPAEYAKATARIDAILEAAGNVPRDRFFAVPGNHDVQRKIQDDAWRGLRTWIARTHDRSPLGRWLHHVEGLPIGLQAPWREQILERTAAFWSWLDAFRGAPLRAGGSIPLGYRATVPAGTISDRPIHIIGLDSAWLCGADESVDGQVLTDRGAILLTDEQVEAHVRDGEHGLGGLRICLVHHPLDQLADQRAVRRLLGGGAVDLLLHGHQHYPGITFADEPGAALRIVAAGCLIEGDLGKGWPNGFHVIELDPASGAGAVHLRKWSKDGQFWAKATDIYRNASDGVLRWNPAGSFDDKDPS